LNWATVTNNTTNILQRVIYAAGTYVALSDNNVLTSSDGTNWMRRSAPIPSNVYLQAITYHNGTFLTVGSTSGGGAGVAYVSDPVAGLNLKRSPAPTLELSGLVGRSYRIERLDDLSSTNWQSATTLILTNSPITWSDSQAPNSYRFYRAVLLP